MAEQPDQPTAKQQRYLRALAQRTGQTFTTPTTRAQASREIDRLRRIPRSTRFERELDRQTVAGRVGETPASSVRCEEISGYGASATWRRA